MHIFFEYRYRYRFAGTFSIPVPVPVPANLGTGRSLGTGQWNGRRDDVSDCFCSRVVTGTSYLWYRTMEWETGRRQWLFLQPSCYGYVISMVQDNEVGDGTTSVTVFAAELLRVRHICGTGQWSGRRDDVSDCFCSRVVTGTSYLWYRTMKWETGRRQWLFLQPSCYGYVISMVQDNEVGDGTTSVTVFAAELLRVRHIYGTVQWSGRRDDVSDCFCSRDVTGTSYLWYRTMKWETGRRQWLFLQPSCYGYVISMAEDNEVGDGTTSVTVFCSRDVTGTSYLWYRTMKWETGRRQWLFLQPRCYGYVISMAEDNEVGDGTTSVTVFAAELLRVRHVYGTGQWSGRRDDVSDCFCSRVVTGTSYLWQRTMKWETGRRQWLFLQPSCYGYVISMVQDNEVGDGTTSVTVFAAELLRVRHIYGTGQWSGRRDDVSDCFLQPRCYGYVISMVQDNEVGDGTTSVIVFCSRVVTGTSYLWYRTMKWETGRRQWLFLQPRCYGYVISMVQDNEVGDGTTSVTVFAAELLRVRHIYGTGQWSGRRDDVSDCFCSRDVTGTSYLWYRTMKWETGRHQWLFLQPSCYGYVISMVQDNEVGDGTTSVTVFAAEMLRVRHIYGTGQWSGRRDDISDCFCSRVVTGTSYLWYRTMKWETGRRQWLFLQPSCYGYVISMVQAGIDRYTNLPVPVPVSKKYRQTGTGTRKKYALLHF